MIAEWLAVAGQITDSDPFAIHKDYTFARNV